RVGSLHPVARDRAQAPRVDARRSGVGTPPARHAAGDRRFASWITRHRRSDVAGIGTSVTPSGAKASKTALVRQATAPTVPASPAPFAPSGLRAVGTPSVAISKNGISSARGIV